MKKVRATLTIKESTGNKVDVIRRFTKTSISRLLEDVIIQEYNKFMVSDNNHKKETYRKINLTISNEAREMMTILQESGIEISPLLDKRINEEYDKLNTRY